MAVQDYELLLRVRADLVEAINGLKGLGDTLGQGDAAAQHLGESADQATQRIRNMVQASREQAAAQDRVAESMRSINERAASLGTAPAGSSASAQAEAAAFNAAVRAKQEALAVLNAAFTANIATAEGAAAAETALDSAMAAGAITAREQGAYIQKLDAAKVEDAVVTEAATAATNTNTAAMAVNAGVTRELGVLMGELARGNTARLEGSMITLANRTGLMTLLFNPLTLAIGAAAGALGLLFAAYEKGAEQSQKFNTAVALTSGYLGVTQSQFRAMAQGMANSGATIGQAEDALLRVANTGKIAGDSLETVAKGALDMSRSTGQSVQQAVDAFVKLGEDPVAAILKLNEQYHFLTQSTLDHIKALEDEGDQEAATQAAQQALAEHFGQVVQQQQEQLGSLQRWWQNVRDSASKAWDAMLGIGRQKDAGEQLEKVQDWLNDHALNMGVVQFNAHVGHVGYEPGANFKNASPDFQAEILHQIALYNQLKSATQQSDQAAADTSAEKKRTQAVMDADAAIDKMTLSYDRQAQKAKAIQQLNAQWDKLFSNSDGADARLEDVIRHANPDGSTSFSGGLYDQQLADINKRYATKAPRAKSDTGAIDAQQQLIKLLNDEQGALDPVAKAWATYNDKVQQANELAARAKIAHNADAVAIDAQRAAVIATAAAVRDAAIAAEAQKDRDAFEKLKQSLKGADGIKFDELTAQLSKLRDWLDKGTISSSEYHNAVQGVLNTQLKPLPTYKGIGSSVGGPMGELDKIHGVGDDLDKVYADELKYLVDQNQKKLLADKDFIAAENALYADYYQKKQALQDASNQVIMTGIASQFSEAASLIGQSLGKQSAAYRAAFALAKGAAIAQATLNLSKAISNAGGDVPFPANLAAMASIGASMMALISQITSIQAGFSGGGYTGPGGVQQPAGIVHAGEVVFSQRDVARHGGPAAVEALRLGGAPGFAGGGYVPALPPMPQEPGLSAEVADAAAARNGSAAASGKADAGQTHIHVWSMEQAAEEIAKLPAFEKAVVHVVGENPRTIQGKWGK